MLDLPLRAAVVVLGSSAGILGRQVRDLLPGAQLFGPRGPAGEWDESYDRLAPLLVELFLAGRPIIGLCASGILIRILAPHIADKRSEPPVVALAEDGSVAVPLLGGHHGANGIARVLAEALGGAAAITTAGDVRLGVTLDELPTGWRIANPAQVKPFAAALLAGEKVALIEEAAPADWLHAGQALWADAARRQVIVTYRDLPPDADRLVVHPPVLAVGIGCERSCSAAEVEALARKTVADAGLAASAVAAIVSIELKSDEPAVHVLAGSLGVPARFFSAAQLLQETPRLTIRSDAAFRATGCWGVAEGAALAAVGAAGKLIVPRQQSERATCAVARAVTPIDPTTLGRPRGRLAIIGIGPGASEWRTPEANALIAAADEVVGYRLYLDLLGPAIAGKCRHDSVIGEEEVRVRLALERAAAGASIALVSSGDAGIYGLATLVFELIDRECRRDWSAVEITVAPGISAMQAAAARLGAPLGHDFCAISLSNLLTPWDVIRARLDAAAAADFVVALYNPRSRSRPHLLTEAAAILLQHRSPATWAMLARNLGRSEETMRVCRLDELAAADADMLSLVLVGNSQTRLIPGEPPRLYTPRGYFRRASTAVPGSAG